MSTVPQGLALITAAGVPANGVKVAEDECPGGCENGDMGSRIGGDKSADLKARIDDSGDRRNECDDKGGTGVV